MLSYDIYSYTYELEYSYYVIILIYELVYSLCVMKVAHLTLCLNTHITCESGHGAAPLGYGHTRGAAAPQQLPPRPNLLWRLHATMQHRSTTVSLFSKAKQSITLV